MDVFFFQVVDTLYLWRSRDRVSLLGLLSAGSSILLHVQSSNEGPNRRASWLAFVCIALPMRLLDPVLFRSLLLIHTQILPASLFPPPSSNTPFLLFRRWDSLVLFLMTPPPKSIKKLMTCLKWAFRHASLPHFGAESIILSVGRF